MFLNRKFAWAILAASLGFAVAISTNTISAQELGKTITSPFGIARQPSASESGSDGDTFIDPETGEVGHIIRNPFGQANPDGVDTGIDIPDSGEEVGGIITSPFGVPASDNIDTGVDVFDEDDEYLISLPDDEESEVEDSEDADEVDDETSDDAKEIEEETEETTTEKVLPVIDNPTRGVEYTIELSLTGSTGDDYSVTSTEHNISYAPTLYVATGGNFTLTVASTDNQTLVKENISFYFDGTLDTLSEVFENKQYLNGSSTLTSHTFSYHVNPSAYGGLHNVAVIYHYNNDETIVRYLKIEVVYIGLQMATYIIGVNNLDIDADGIPDYADGFDSLWGGVSENNKSHPFNQLKLSVSKNLNFAEYDVLFCFYEASCDIVRHFTGNGTIPYYYTCDSADDGSLIRIWTKDGPVARQKENIYTDYPNVSGDYVPPGIAIPLQSLFNSGEYVESNQFYERMLYIEGICADVEEEGTAISCCLRRKQTSNNIASSSLNATVVKVDLVDPVRADNSNQQTGNMGEQSHYEAIKILIETDSASEALLRAQDPDPDHYKTYYTSAQEHDHQVNITAHITPEMNNVPVYFEVIDPDDLSPYEGKTYTKQNDLIIVGGSEDLFANDNLDTCKKMGESASNYTVFQNACLKDKNGNFSRLALTNDLGEATINLNITESCSGDNYIVRASCIDPGRIDQVKLRPFDKYSIAPPPVSGVTNNEKLGSLQYESKTTIAQTALLVAWKRTYIEQGNMYKNGATILSSIGGTELIVDNIDDFAGESNIGLGDGSEVTIFFPNNEIEEYDRRVVSIDTNDNTITLDASIPIQIPAFSGVKLKDDEEVFLSSNATTSFIPFLNKAFGDNADGGDGGAFIEFKVVLTHNIPKYKELPNASIMRDYGFEAWFFNNQLRNTMFLATANDSYFHTLGTSNLKYKMSYIWYGNHQGNNQNPNDSVVHEVGHIWNLVPLDPNSDPEPDANPVPNHIDESTNWPNHELLDQCMMSYLRNRMDNHMEFCLDCLIKLRKQKNLYIIEPSSNTSP